ncbi:cytochrome bc complex cytochrome b subunit [Candidatus Saccharibacteria bacterium]|nr:cytochrome bc complex cytochrome b subunit [Candidatus Saccharibacteria bacterium]
MTDGSKGSLLAGLNYRVPAYANRILYMFGGITLAAFLILGLSGAYLTQFYNPSINGAHDSILSSITNVPLFDFTRSLHFWVANLVIILLLLHITRVFITGSYKKPRRETWLTGVALLGITVTYIFIGTVLKWDQEAIEAYGHVQESLGLFGVQIGLTNAGVPIISQLYAWHITILFLLLLGLLSLHLFMIKAKGISAKPEKGAVAAVTAGQGQSSFLLHLRRLAGFGLLFLAAASLLAVASPAPIGQPGVLEHEVTRPLWMFWPFYGLEDLFGLKGLVWGLVGFFAILALIPFIDRGPYLHWAKRKLILSFGFVFLAATIGLGVYSRLQPAEAHIEGAEESSEMATEGGAVMAEEPAQHEEKITSEQAVEPSPDELDIDHSRLRDEALYLIPAAAVVGLVGTRLAFKPDKDKE